MFSDSVFTTIGAVETCHHIGCTQTNISRKRVSVQIQQRSEAEHGIYQVCSCFVPCDEVLGVVLAVGSGPEFYEKAKVNCRKAHGGVSIGAVNDTIVRISHCNQFRMTLVQDS